MASPNYDQLHIDHSKRVEDPVATAATDGKIWSSVLRDIHLNEACRRLMAKYLKAAEIREDNGLDASKYWDFFRELITEESETLTNNIVALSNLTGPYAIIEVENTTDGITLKRLSEGNRFVALNETNPFFKSSSKHQYWTLDGANFRLLDGATNTGDSVKFRYIKSWTALTQANATDIPIPSKYFHQVLNMAYVIAMEERPDPAKHQLARLKEEEVNKEIAALG